MNGKNTYYVDLGKPNRFINELYSGSPRTVGRYVIFDCYITPRTRSDAWEIIVNEDDRTYWLKKNGFIVDDIPLTEGEHAMLMLQILRSERWIR